QNSTPEASSKASYALNLCQWIQIDFIHGGIAANSPTVPLYTITRIPMRPGFRHDFIVSYSASEIFPKSQEPEPACLRPGSYFGSKALGKASSEGNTSCLLDLPEARFSVPSCCVRPSPSSARIRSASATSFFNTSGCSGAT